MLIGGNPPNYFDSGVGYVPSGYGNSGNNGSAVVIGSGIEFGFMDGANTDTADFTGSTLTLTDVTVGGSSLPITYVFTDPAFTSLNLLTNGFPSGLTYSLSGDTITISTPDLESNGTRSVEFAVSSAATPEPGSLALLGTGMLGFCGAVRRRMKV